MQVKAVSVAAFCVAMVGGAALAAESATLGSVDGSVSIAREGAVSAAQPGALQIGDRVIATDGTATLTFSDGCVAHLDPNSMMTVQATSPCASGQGLIKAADPATAQTWSDMSAAELTGAALVGGLITAGLISVLDDDDGLPVSP
jgi:predicted metalloprotease with PDZ domain